MGAGGANPAEAYRRAAKARELKRNKAERQLRRAAGAKLGDPRALRRELQELDAELEGLEGQAASAARRKRKVLADAYEAALRRARAEEVQRRRQEASAGAEPSGNPGTGAEPRPEDSLYFHPVLNPTGAPPPGKPAKYRAPQPVRATGTGRSLPPPESPTHGAGQGQQPPPQAGATLLGAPPGFPTPLDPVGISPPPGVWPPPPGPPPAVLPPPSAPPPAALPPPPGPPPPDLGAPTGEGRAPPAREQHTVGAEANLTIGRAEKNKELLSMVPASLRTKRPKPAKPARGRAAFGFGFGVVDKDRPAESKPGAGVTQAPEAASAGGTVGAEDPMAAFMQDMEGLGAFK